MKRSGIARVWMPLVALSLMSPSSSAAAGREPNTAAISMFLAFVLLTLGITYWAARRTRSTSDFYAAGSRIGGFQNGLAIAGDFMSAATFLGISGLAFLAGFDALLFCIGGTVGWAVILLLIAERLRNLGRYTFADVVAVRLDRVPIRGLAAVGTLAVVQPQEVLASTTVIGSSPVLTNLTIPSTVSLVGI